MLTSPQQDAQGFCSTFTIYDVQSLKTMGVNRDEATTAASWIDGAEQFLAAYGARIDEKDASRMLSILETRMVLYVHKKSCDTRTSFASMRDIAGAFYLDMKKKDERIPKWSKLGDFTDKPEVSKKKNESVVLRETGNGVSEDILSEKGFKVDGLLQDNDQNVYELKSLNADAKTVTLKLIQQADPKAKSKPDQKKIVDRTDLLEGSSWQPCADNKKVFFPSSKISDPLQSKELMASIVSGIYKNALALEWQKSSCDEDCDISISPNVKVYANKQFKSGAFKLIGMTHNINVASPDKVMLGGVFVGSGEDWQAHVRSSNSSFSKQKLSKDLDIEKMVVPYWAAYSTHDQSVCNCVLTDKKVEVNILGDKVEMSIPMIVSTSVIKAGDEIIVHKAGEAIDSSAKRATSSQPKIAAKKKRVK